MVKQVCLLKKSNECKNYTVFNNFLLIGRVVASRYLQAADAKVKTSLSVLHPKVNKTGKTFFS